MTAPTRVPVVAAETCSTDEACGGAALQALVIPTGLLGAGPGMRHSRCFRPQVGLSGLGAAKLPGSSGQGIEQSCQWGHFLGE